MTVDKKMLKINILEFFDRDVYLNKKSESLASILLQIDCLYRVSPVKPSKDEVKEVLQELVNDGYLKEYKVGSVLAWSLTDEGKKFIEELRNQ